MLDLDEILAEKSYHVAMQPDEIFKELEKHLDPVEYYLGFRAWRLARAKARPVPNFCNS
jgi:hypothetical protein